MQLQVTGLFCWELQTISSPGFHRIQLVMLGQDPVEKIPPPMVSLRFRATVQFVSTLLSSRSPTVE
jgi:hypothetical protein